MRAHDSLVLHPQTQAQLQQLLLRPNHAILVTGETGVGKGSLARMLAVQLLKLPGTTSLSNHAYYTEIHPEGQAIPIAAIRDLQRFVTLKTTGRDMIRRAVVVEQADKLTVEAQNAFLKLLEEPPDDTVIILTARSDRSLLPTIVSRTQQLPVIAPSEAAILEHFEQKFSKTEAQKAHRISGGYPGLMQAILEGDTAHPLIEAIETAKQLLQKPRFERLCEVETLAKQKEQLPLLFQALARIAQAALEQAAAKNNTTLVRRWHGVLSGIYEAQTALSANVQPKLLLTSLFLNFS